MLFIVVQESKVKLRDMYGIDLQFIEADNKRAAIKKASRLQDSDFKSPYAEPVTAGTRLRV